MIRRLGHRYAFIVAGVTFVALLVSAGLRSAPSVMMLPLEAHFGWDRATISAASAIGLMFYGLVGPFAAALMQTMGIKRTMLGGLALMSLATFASLWMREPWHYVATWGIVSGIGSGAVASVLGAAIVNRWFASRQGLVMGMLTASTATGALVFLPVIARLSEGGAWRPVAMAVTIATALLIPIVWLLVPERPQDIGADRFGAAPGDPPPAALKQARSAGLAIGALVRATRVPMFWLLFGTFFVCGLTTNGLVGTHMIAFCGDMGIAPVQAAGLLSLMGLFDLVGTTASGWLTDRYDPRRLLFVYYALRGASLMVLPFVDFSTTNLLIFAIFYGLDWIATVPPTVRLAYRHFGEVDAPIIFGWVMVGHQLGAATAAFGAGLVREVTGSYAPAFAMAGVAGVIAALAVLMLARGNARPVGMAAA